MEERIIELFSRRTEMILLPAEAVLTPLPIEDDISIARTQPDELVDMGKLAEDFRRMHDSLRLLVDEGEARLLNGPQNRFRLLTYRVTCSG
jgi:hypothetical protein